MGKHKTPRRVKVNRGTAAQRGLLSASCLRFKNKFQTRRPSTRGEPSSHQPQHPSLDESLVPVSAASDNRNPPDPDVRPRGTTPRSLIPFVKDAADRLGRRGPRSARQVGDRGREGGAGTTKHNETGVQREASRREYRAIGGKARKQIDREVQI